MNAVSCNGEPVDAGLLDAALVNYGHFTSLQVRAGAVQGWALHLRRLQQGTRELFDAELDEARLLDWLRQALVARGMQDASLRITVFSRAFDFRQPLRAVPVDVLVSVAAPAMVPGQARAVLPVRYQRELPQLKHAGTLPLFQQLVSSTTPSPPMRWRGSAACQPMFDPRRSFRTMRPGAPISERSFQQGDPQRRLSVRARYSMAARIYG